MRLTRETLLKFAQDAATQRARRSRGLICVYLSGSLLGETPLLGGAADIDLICIHDSEPAYPREMQAITADVHFDMAHISQSRFQQPRTLRTDPWIGAFLCQSPLLLYEVQHWFEFTQASVSSQFRSPENVITRARNFSSAARQGWLNLQMDAGGETPQRVLAFLTQIEQSGNALASLSGTPLTERRFFLDLPRRAESASKAQLTGDLIALADGDALGNIDWNTVQPLWHETLKAAAARTDCPLRLHACRHHYYTRAVSSLIEEMPAAALWIVLRTWTRAVDFLSLAEDDPRQMGWKALCTQTGLLGEAWEERLERMDGCLDQVEETLDNWAARAGIR